jgi:hypothetical protein
MHSPDALLPTQPVPAGPPPPRPLRRPPPWKEIASAAAGIVVGLLVGVAIGRAMTSESATTTTPATAASTGRLKVSSKPADGNVIVDGRFVGVSPVERIDLEPGKHTIVIDVFGYQPYAGTLDIEPLSPLTLTVLLAPIGARDATTTGTAVGAGKATFVPVPASALLPAASAPAPPRATSRRSQPSVAPTPSQVEQQPQPPPRPRRDCEGEKSTCRDHCSRASFDCRSSCPNCVGCPSSVGWDECKRQCDTCRGSCEQNTKFCESGCDAQYSSCSASR